MFKPLSLFIGIRYTQAKKRSQFVSFISLMSMLGIALGVMVLITVLSVMNGFDQQIRAKLFVLVPHITITGVNNQLSNWKPLEAKLQTHKNITSVTPIVTGQALLTKDGVTSPAMINGVIPTGAHHVLNLKSKVVEGKLADLKPGQFGIVLGQGLAANLGVVVGDTVNLVTPTASVTPVGVIPRFKQFKVVGVFSAGEGFGFDNSYAYIDLKDAQTLFMLGHHISALQLRIKDLFNAPEVAWKLQQTIGEQDQVSDWTTRFGAFYHAVKMEKTIMFFILLLIIAVAAFNLVSSLMMGVNDKASDIAILRTLGARPKTIMLIFVVQGAMIGLIGTLMGVVAGIILSLNVTSLVNFIQNTFGVQFVSANVYFVNFLPSQLQFSDVWHVALIAFAMSIVATLYPAWRASRIQPAEALRYE